VSDELPDGWVLTTLAAVCRSITDGDHQAPPKAAAGIPFITISAMNDGVLRLNKATRFVPSTYFAGLKPERRPEVGDVLYSVTGSIGLAALVEASAPFVFQRHIAILKPNTSCVTERFLRHRVAAADIKTQGEAVATGTAQLTIPLNGLRMFSFALPPLSEQRRIVAKVEALLARVSTARERLEKVPHLLKRFRQSVLAAACSGELTREWRARNTSTPPASTELSALFAQRRSAHEKAVVDARTRGTRKPSTPKNLEPAAVPDGLPVVPDGWKWVLFDDVCDDITVGHVGPMMNEYVARGVPFLRSQNVRPFRFDPEGLKYVSSTFHNRLAKSALKPGDIVVVRSGNAGEACVVPSELPEANCSDLVIMRPSDALDARYGVIFINSSAARAHIQDVKVGIAQGHYNIGSARLTPVPLPPRAEQMAIVAAVEHLFDLAASLERAVLAATTRAHALPQAILQKAFAGELVPTEAELAFAEGRTFESAEELLQRVCSVQSAAATPNVNMVVARTRPRRTRAPAVGV
jgi:type I restriction enzyme S subunit